MSTLDTLQILPANQQGVPKGHASDTDAANASTPTFGTTFGAAYDSATDSTGAVQDWRKRVAYDALARELATATGMDEGAFYMGGQSDTKVAPSFVWQEINNRRQSDPNFLKDVGADQGEFEKRVLSRGGQYQIDAATARQGNWLANLAGSAAAAWHDPIQVGALFTPGFGVELAGRGILANGLARMGVSAATNAAYAAAEEPLTIQSRANLGQTTTAGDVVGDIAGAAVFGGVLHVATEAGSAVLKPVIAAGRDAFETGLGHAYAALPDSVLANHFADKTAPWERTPEEQSALHVVGRQGDIDATNPYGASYAAMAVHQARLGDAVGALDQGRAPGAGPPVPAQPNGSISPNYYAKIGLAEDASGNPNASPGTSSARGQYQFIDSTWLRLYKARFGADGQTDAQIIAHKTDTGLQNVLVRDLTQHNADYLRRQNIPADDANLYLTHFAGPDDAVRLIEADPHTPVEQVMHPRSIEANPWLKGKTAGQVRAWAERKMGGRGFGDAAPARPAMPEDDGGAAAAAGDAENAAMDAEEITPADAAPTAQQTADPNGSEPRTTNPATPADAEPTISNPPNTIAPAPDAGALPMPHNSEPPLSSQLIMPMLREAVGNKTIKLNDFEALAARLNASVDDVRQGLDRLVAKGELSQRSDNGAYTRARPPGRAQSLIEWIKRGGGITDPGGDFHAMDLNQWWKGGPFRDKKPIIAEPGTPDRGADKVMRAAVEAGYFPEHRNKLDASGPDELDTNDLHKAIDLELRGHARYPVGTTAFEKQGGARIDATWHPVPEEVPSSATRSFEEIWNSTPEWQQQQLAKGAELFGRKVQDFDPWILDRAQYLWHEDGQFGVHDLHEAFVYAVDDYANKIEAEAVAERGGLSYDDIDAQWPTYHDGERGGEGQAAAPDFSGREFVDWPASESEPRGGSDGGAGEGEKGPLDPAAYAEYDDPAGDRIAKAADSAWHDIDARQSSAAENDPAIDPATAERDKQRATLAADAPLRKPMGQEGTMGLGLFDASDQPVFDLSSGDPAAKIADIHAALDADQAALDAINSCL